MLATLSSCLITIVTSTLYDLKNNTIFNIITIFLAFALKGMACVPLCTFLSEDSESMKLFLAIIELASLIANRTTNFNYL